MSKCKEYNQFSVLCQDCEYPINIQCSKEKPQTQDEMEEELCKYCLCTDYGNLMEATQVRGTPMGYTWCEGSYCDEAYKKYLEEFTEEE